MRTSSWIIRVGPKCHHEYLHKREAEIYQRHTEGNVTMKAPCGAAIHQRTPRNDSSSQKLQEAKKEYSPGASMVALLTP